MQDFGNCKKIMKFVKRFWPVIFIFILWFIFSSPYFLQGKVPYSSTYQVNHFFPWSSYEKFWGPVKNEAMPDVHSQIYPWKKLTIDTYKLGQIPFWNPYNFSGNPHLANFQSAVLSPFNLLFFIFPFIDAWSLLILIQPILAGIFMYMMLRSFKLSREGSLIGSISFMFCGFMTVWMAYGTLVYAALYVPLGIFLIQKFSQTQNKRFLILLSLTVPLSFFSGHFQISLYFFLTIILFAIYRRSLSSVLAIFSGLLLSFPQISLSIQFYKESVRSGIFMITEAIPFKYLVTSFVPDFFGNPVTRNNWFGHYAEWSSFTGLVPLIFLFFLNFKKNRDVIFFILLGIISLILAAESPLSNIIVSLKIPVISTSSLSRIIILTSFSVSALSAFGFDNFLEWVNKKRFIKIYVKLLFVLIVVIFLSTFPLFGMHQDKISIAVKALRVPVSLFIIFVVSIFVSSKIKVRYLSFIFIMLTSLQSLYFAAKWMPFDPRELVYPKLPVIDAIGKNIGEDRIFGNFGAEISSYYKFPSIDGYDPLYIGRYGEFIRSADSGTFKEGERSLVKISRRGEHMSRVLDLLGVSLIFHPIADTNQNWAFPVWEDKNRFKLLYQDDKFQLFKNESALNRAQLFYDYEVVNDKQKEIERFYNRDFNFRDTLLLEESLSSNLKKGTGTAKIASYTPDKVSINVQTTMPALLFLSDNYYPGWKARVNGKETKIYRADYSFRAVIVPPGDSTVEFLFVPGF